jgi:hypothetical protein
MHAPAVPPAARHPSKPPAPASGSRSPRPGWPTELSMHERMPGMAPYPTAMPQAGRQAQRSGQRPGELAPSARSSNITSAPMVCAALLLPSALVPPAHLTDANAWPGSLICALHDAASVRLHACMHHSVPCRMACKAVFSGSAWPAPSGARCRCMHKHLGMREYKRWRRCVCDPVHGRPAGRGWELGETAGSCSRSILSI